MRRLALALFVALTLTHAALRTLAAALIQEPTS